MLINLINVENFYLEKLLVDNSRYLVDKNYFVHVFKPILVFHTKQCE